VPEQARHRTGATSFAANCGDSGSWAAPAAAKTTAATATVKVGKATFVLDNLGTVEPEVVIIKTDVHFDQLEIGSNDRISEDLSVGEISETAAEEAASVQLKPKPVEDYILACNIGGGGRLGMRAALTLLLRSGSNLG